MKNAVFPAISVISLIISTQAANQWYIEQKIPPPQTTTNPRGWAIPVDISGDTCIMSVFTDSENGIRSGAVYVYRFNGTEWVEEQKLTDPNRTEENYFGYGAAVSHGTIIIGAPKDSRNVQDSGIAHVFRHDGSRWVRTQKLMSSDRQYNNLFGKYVSLSGDLCVIASGAWNSDLPSQVHVFRFEGERWNEEASFDFSYADVSDLWGRLRIAHVPYEHGYSWGQLAVGAPGDDEAAEDAGAVYLYEDSSGQWRMAWKILPPEPEEKLLFGDYLAYDGEFLAVSVPELEDREGFIYVYRRSSGIFHDPDGPLPEQKITVPQQDKDKVFGFGRCVAVDGDTLITTALKIVPQDPYYADGIVYIYEYNGSTWFLNSRIQATDSRQEVVFYGPFLWPVAIDEDMAMLGAHGSMWGDGMTYIYRRCPTADVTGDCYVNLADFSVLAQQWLTGFHPWPHWP